MSYTDICAFKRHFFKKADPGQQSKKNQYVFVYQCIAMKIKARHPMNKLNNIYIILAIVIKIDNMYYL